MAKVRNYYFFFALICTFSVANIYYNQPLLNIFLKDFHANPSNVGIIPLVVQATYALGLIFFVPLADFFSRKKILVYLLLTNCLASFLASFSQNLIQFLVFNTFIGMTSVGAQIIIPMVSLIAAENEKGKAVGLVMSGLMTGVLLGRILSGIIGESYGWHSVYRMATFLDLCLIFLILKVIPNLNPSAVTFKYSTILKSLFSYFIGSKELRYICISGGLIFAAVSSLWGALAFLLTQSPYHYGSDLVGSFGLTGIVGIFITPYIGKLIDQFKPTIVIILASIFCIFGFCLILLAQISPIFIVLGLILLDIGARANLVGNQLNAFSLSTNARSRLNTIFMFSYFLGGAFGTWFGSILSYQYGWLGIAIFGSILSCLNLFINIIKINKIFASQS